MGRLKLPNDHVDRSENTQANVAMFHAITSRNIKKLRKALVAGAKPTKVNQRGHCPLHLALHQILSYGPTQRLARCKGHYDGDNHLSNISYQRIASDFKDDESTTDDDSDASDDCSDFGHWKDYGSQYRDNSCRYRRSDSAKIAKVLQAEKAQLPMRSLQVVAEMVDLLLKHGADPNCESQEGETLLYQVIRFKSDRTNIYALESATKLIDLFFSYGVCWSYSSKNPRFDPFRLALKKRNWQALRLFVDYDYQLNMNKAKLFRIPSWNAVLKVDVFEILARAGFIDVNTKDRDGLTAFYTVILCDELFSMDRVKMMLDLGGKINRIDHRRNGSLMYLAADRGQLEIHEYNELIRSLVTHGGDLLKHYKSNKPTPMALILRYAPWDLVEWCLDRIFESGKTMEEVEAINPLSEAIGGHRGLLEKLIVKGFDVDRKEANTQSSALSYAVDRYASYDDVKTLLEWGANVNSANKMGNTSLHESCETWYEGAEDRTELLLMYGADINSRNSKWKLPFDILMAPDYYNPNTQNQMAKCLVRQIVLEQSQKHAAQCEGDYDSDSDSSESSDEVIDSDNNSDSEDDGSCTVDSNANDNGSDIDPWKGYNSLDDSEHSDSSCSCRSYTSCGQGAKTIMTLQAEKVQVVADMVELLLEQGADPNCRCKGGKTLLYNVIRIKNEQTNIQALESASKLVNLFFSFGVNWSYSTKKSRFNPFCLALKRKNDEALRLFLEHGFQLDKINVPLSIRRFRSWNPILVMNVFEVLAQAGIFPVNVKSKEGFTALYTLICSKLFSMERAKFIVSLGAKINTVEDIVGGSLMYLATQDESLDDNTYCQLIRLLVTHGGDLIENYGYGSPPPLSMVISHGNWNLVEWCVDRAIESGKTMDELNAINPLSEAMGYEKIFNGLILRGLDVNHKDSFGSTVLHKADVQYSITLLEWGADVNSANKWGHIPLHDSCNICSEPLTELLLSYGADINCRSHRNELPLDIVMNSRHGFETQEKVMKRIVAQVVIQQSEGRPVDDQYMTYIRNNLSDFYHQCQTEIAVAQTSSFTHLLTFYNLLTSNNLRYHFRYGFSYDPSVSDILLCQYPIYGKRMSDRLLRAQQQNELFTKAEQSLSRILGFDHHAFHLIFDKIMRTLSQLDLYNLGRT
ncbi:hypothetical protein QAD02_010539 [Eretmocerus hayati]|uniref:Uncharacterized protein n=1 Tax=Eretmocerus hayati TaxID=131215 RepID=A0ACC2NU88_9HYME|nr:hypothetical protein QAD02_010539 [Eretmocerus hayati]